MSTYLRSKILNNNFYIRLLAISILLSIIFLFIKVEFNDIPSIYFLKFKYLYQIGLPIIFYLYIVTNIWSRYNSIFVIARFHKTSEWKETLKKDVHSLTILYVLFLNLIAIINIMIDNIYLFSISGVTYILLNIISQIVTYLICFYAYFSLILLYKSNKLAIITVYLSYILLYTLFLITRFTWINPIQYFLLPINSNFIEVLKIILTGTLCLCILSLNLNNLINKKCKDYLYV